MEAKIAMSVVGKIMNLVKASPEKRKKRTLKLARKAKLLRWLGVNSKGWQASSVPLKQKGFNRQQKYHTS